MSSEENAVSDAGTQADDYADSYYKLYNQAHLDVTGSYGWETPHWRHFFTMVAERIVGLVEPTTVLDVGCAKGLLVQALAEQGVDSAGFDISNHAVASAHPDVRDRLHIGSATEPIEKRYDLVTCIEVLEHLAPEDAQKAIDNICAATDRVLFSSSPADFDEATHINTHPTAQWAAWFAERGFYRRTDADTTFLATWAILFERGELSKRAIVERYEAFSAPLSLEVLEKRQALLKMHRELSGLKTEDHVARQDEAFQRRHDALVARDNVIGLEAQIATLNNQLSVARGRIQSLRDRLEVAQDEILDLRESRTWRAGRAIVGPIARFKR